VSDSPILARLAVVLWRPKSPGNVGSVARAMKNMGIGDLRIAEPRRYDDPAYFDTESRKMAWDADDVLEARREFPSLDEALADAVLVAGTTSRPPAGHAALSPRDLAPVLLDAARSGTVALLFEQENIGLTRDVLSRCQRIGTIPASSAYPSLNLAQAALVFLYEIRLAALAGAGRTGDAPAPPVPGAPAPDDDDAPPTQEDLGQFHQRLARTLEAIGFFQGDARDHMSRELRGIFNRALLTRREVRILEGIVRRVDLLRRGGPASGS
jgi:TrmH family RNA methyltransferase